MHPTHNLTTYTWLPELQKDAIRVTRSPYNLYLWDKEEHQTVADFSQLIPGSFPGQSTWDCGGQSSTGIGFSPMSVSFNLCSIFTYILSLEYSQRDTDSPHLNNKGKRGITVFLYMNFLLTSIVTELWADGRTDGPMDGRTSRGNHAVLGRTKDTSQ